MINDPVIPLDAPLRMGTHPECICRSCRHIAADWSWCKPRITELSKSADHKYTVVKQCSGYESAR